MTDNELEDLRKKVKDKKSKELIEQEKRELREKLEKGTVKSAVKKIGKNLFKKLME